MRLHIGNHTYNLAWLGICTAYLKRDLLTQRILSVQVAFHEFLIHQNHTRSFGSIVIRKCAAADQWNSRCNEEIGSDYEIYSIGRLVRSWLRFIFDVKHDASRCGSRQIRAGCDMLNSGESVQA